jgi:hypothetical protein
MGKIKSKLKKQYRDLEMSVLFNLKVSINNSETYSKFIAEQKCIKVNIFDYHELVMINGALSFLDSNGYGHSIFTDCTLEDLIDLVKH